jgi:hypothetical protein
MALKGFKILAAMVFAGLLSSCSVYTHTMTVEVRKPSRSTLDMAGKSISVVCVSDKPYSDTSYLAQVSAAFVNTLEKEYFAGKQDIDIYSVMSADTTAYASKDSLVNFVIKNETDIVIMLQEHKLYAYDSLNSKDRVVAFPYSHTKLSAENVGKRAAGPFMSTWGQESYSFYFYDSGEWLETAIALDSDYDWKKAMDSWMSLLNTKNMEKKACAEYNIALACYMLGDKKLALEWLDLCDKDFQLSLSPGLRKRIIE